MNTRRLPLSFTGGSLPLPRLAVVGVLVLTSLTAAPGRNAAAGPPEPAPLDWRSAAEALANRPAPKSPPLKPMRSAPAIRSAPGAASRATALPAAGSSTFALGAPGAPRAAGRSPVGVAARGAGAQGRTVTVEVLDAGVAARAGVSGFVFRLSGRGSEPLPATVSVDYSGFAGRFGAGYADRLKLVALPACALADPVPARCARGGTPLATRHDRAGTRLVVDVADAAKLSVLAVTAGAEGEDGSFKATPMALSGDWEVNPGSGNFAFDYPVPLAPAPAGPTPQLAFHYSSGSVDGLVSGSNTQSGPVGLGWADLAGSFIERRYNSCFADGQGSADLCWKSDNATISLNGQAGELVRVPGSNPKQWRLRDDSRWRVEQLTGAPNGDNDGEYWKVTTPDGVQYFFGRGVNPDVGVETQSAWTVPVFGDDAGEPCSTLTPVAWCPQAWRWNLDLVIDPHDNVQQWEYQKEINYYAALNGWPGFEHTAYVRSGVLRTVKYGKRRVEVEPAAMVSIDVDHRCLALDGCAAPTTATAASYPDTPVDLMCLTAVCSQHSPTFFTALRYTSLTTYVDDNGFTEVDAINLAHAWPDPDPNREGDQKLYLTGIQRSGRAADTSVTLPAVTFFPVLLNNRVDTAGGLSAMPHYRVAAVTNEYGGQVLVTYGQPHPCPAPIPATPNWDLNTRDCFPHWHAPEGGTAGFAVFHKHVVVKVEERDTTGGSPPMVTTYRYGDQVRAGLPNAAWHHDRDEFAPNAEQSWSEWRGYADVIVAQGDSRTQFRLLRGMNSDRLAGDPFPGPGTRVSRVSSLDGTVTNLADDNWLAGRVLDQQALRTNGTAEWGELTGYHTTRTVDVTATPDPLDDAWLVLPDDTVERLRRADGSYLRRRTQTVYNGLLGTRDRVVEHGWTTVAGDERCTVTTPVFNVDNWLLDLPGTVTRYASTTCDGAEVSREEYAYDGGAFGADPVRGDRTGSRVKLTAAPTWATTTTTYDRLGRPLVVTDPNGHRTTTAYTPDVRYPATTTVTNHLGHVRTTEWFRLRVSPGEETDARGGRVTFDYDALGRLTEVHQATEQVPGAPASYQFGYDIDPDRAGPPVVRTRRLQDGSAGSPRYLDSWVVHDGWMRERQAQRPSPEAGKVIVTTTGYDARGLAISTSEPQAVLGTGGTGLLPVPAGGWANEKTVAYDELRRPFWEITRAGGAYRRSVATAYTPDTVTTTPDPPGGGVVRESRDGLDRAIRVEELDGTEWRPTTYTYDAADRLISARDAAGNTTTTTYDLGGRKVALNDPDEGAWRFGYDAVGNQTSTTSATGQQLHTVYDALDRKRELRRDSAAGPLLSTWDYDAAGERGLLDKSTRFDTTGAWVVDVTGYDGRGRPNGRTWTVPGGVTALAGSYTIGYTYDAADHRRSVTYPAVGGLPAETVTTTYDAVGLPESMTGAAEYLWGAAYDDRARPTWLLSGSRTTPFGRTYEYDADQRLARQRAGAGSTTLQDIQYGYDTTFGRLVDRATTLNGQSWRECYRHDDRQRLVRAFTTTGTCATGSPGTGANPYDHTYSYGVDGNLTRRIEGATPIAYAYPPAGGTRPHAPTAVGGNSYGWTANGDLASRTVAGQTDTFTWSADRRLTAVGDTSFVYDADGARLLRQTTAGATLYVEDHEITKPASGPATAVRTYTFGETAAAVRTASTVEYLATDNQGSVQLTVPSGATAPSKARTYQPYGKPRTADTTSTDRGWIGEVEDRSTGLSYLNARYYDPTIGRFVSPDPVFDTKRPQTLNPYAYGLNNPTAFTDPSGLIPLECATGEATCDHTGSGWKVTPKPPPPPRGMCAPNGARYDQTSCKSEGNPVIVSGPPLSDEEREEILEEAARIRNMDPDRLADIGAGGPCAEAHAAVGTLLGDGVCLTWDGHKFALLNMAEIGSGAPYAGFGVGGLVTNAESSDDLLGNAWCVGGGVGAGGSGSAEVCLSYDDDWEPTGIWTLSGSVGGGIGGDVHITATKTVEAAALTPSSVPDDIHDAWNRAMHGLVCFGRC